MSRVLSYCRQSPGQKWKACTVMTAWLSSVGIPSITNQVGSKWEIFAFAPFQTPQFHAEVEKSGVILVSLTPN
jgi:hypothetical protein